MARLRAWLLRLLFPSYAKRLDLVGAALHLWLEGKPHLILKEKLGDDILVGHFFKLSDGASVVVVRRRLKTATAWSTSVCTEAEWTALRLSGPVVPRA